MIDWLKRAPREQPMIAIGERSLPLVVRRLPQARRLTLRLAPDGSEVRVSMPRWGRTAEALAFARSRADWLARQLAVLPGVEAPGPGGALPYRGIVLAIDHSASAPRKPVACEDAIRIGGPPEALTGRLKRWLERQARDLLAGDLEHYCTLANRPVPKLALSSAQRRWGSCAANGTVRINWRLIMAPDMVRRSVVAHEVAHLVHFDHSPRFHALLSEIYEADIAEANAWLKREGRKLYGHFG